MYWSVSFMVKFFQQLMLYRLEEADEKKMNNGVKPNAARPKNKTKGIERTRKFTNLIIQIITFYME